jgi:uncharacterized membrane protein YfhO
MWELLKKRSANRRKGTLLEERERATERKQRLLAFLLPVLAFYIGFAAHGLWPVGNRHLLAYDLYHQYAPFLLELKRKILSGDTLFFSWAGGLGVNFYSLFTYYVASPLNILTIFFPDQNITEAVMLLTLLKIGFSSLFFREFLCGAFRKSDPLASLFGSFYALSAWVYAYSWNIMWLDTLVWFPLAALGLVQLVRDGKARLFVFSLTLMLVTNYYTAFFGCVFLFFYYFVLRVQFKRLFSRYEVKSRWSEPLVAFGKFAGFSVLSALLAGVVLWPTAKALAITSAANDAFPRGFTFTQAFLDTLGRMTPLRSPNIMSGLPNIYAGIAALLLLPAFFADKKRPRTVRLAYGALLAFLFFSFQSRTLSFLWHGAHYPNSLDFRYAFVFVFLVLAMAYQAVGDELAPKMKTITAGVVLIFILLLVEQKHLLNDTLSHWRLTTFLVFSVGYLMIVADIRKPFRRVDLWDKRIDGQPESTSLLQRGTSYQLFVREEYRRCRGLVDHAKIALGMSKRAKQEERKSDDRKASGLLNEQPPVSLRRLSAWKRLWHQRQIRRKQLPVLDKRIRFGDIRYHRALILLFAFMLLEVLFHAITSAALYQQVAPLGDRQYYTSNPYATEVYEYVAALKREHKGRPWRAEILPDTCVNDPFLFGTNGLSLFASPYPQAPIDYFSDLGYPTNGVNSMQYKESTIVMDSILSINHLIVRNGRVFDDRTRTLVATGEETRLYENQDALPFGFFVSSDAGYLDSEMLPDDHLDVQGQLLRALGGEANVFIKDSFVPWGLEGCFVEPSYDPYSFHVVREKGNNEWAFLVYDVPEDGIYYITWEDYSVGITYSNGFVGDDQFFQLGGSKRGIGDVGFLEAGTKLHFRISMSSENAVEGEFRACVYRLDEEAWNVSRKRLAAYPLKLDSFGSGSFDGTITAPETGYLFLPTTINPGWTFKVDGQVTESMAIRDCFIIVPLSAGEHTVSARFVPVGFGTGILMTVAGLITIAAYAVLKRYKKRNDKINREEKRLQLDARPPALL